MESVENQENQNSEKATSDPLCKKGPQENREKGNTKFLESKENHEKHRREKNHFNEAAVDPKYKKGPHERREKGNKLH